MNICAWPTATPSLEARLASAADRQDLLAYQLQELEEFDLKAEEFKALEQDHKRLSRAHTTLASLQQAVDKLEELDDLRHAVRQIQNIDDEHPDLASGQANLASALGLLDDASRDLRHYQDKVVVDPEAMALIESRLNIAQDLARKHRVEPEALHAHAAALRADLDALDADGSSLDEMRSRAEKLKQDFDKRAKTLSTKRRKAAPKFGKAVSQFMQSLGINKGEFAIAFEDHTGDRGLERAEFMVTTNPSFPAGPLTQIASGGEQTRIGLSIQIVAAQNRSPPWATATTGSPRRATILRSSRSAMTTASKSLPACWQAQTLQMKPVNTPARYAVVRSINTA